MSYSLTFGFDGGGTGVSPLRAQLVDTSGASVGSAVTTGFVEIGSNFYMWTGTIPDGHVGGVKFYDNDAPSTILAFAPINPQEAEYADAKTSTRSSHSAADVLAVETSGLTTAGTIGKRIVDNVLQTGDSYARLGAPSGASVSADIAQVTTNTNTTNSRITSTRAGFLDNLATAPPTAAAIRAEMDANSTKLANLDAAISTRLATAGYTVPPTTSAIATAVWAAVTRTLTSSGSVTAQDIADIADAVCDELLSGHTTAGSLGKAVADVLANTAELSGGSGGIAVDHDYGGTDALRLLVAGTPVQNGIIRIYPTAEYDAGNYANEVTRHTKLDGRWKAPAMLDAGDYTITFATSDDRTIGDPVEITVEA